MSTINKTLYKFGTFCIIFVAMLSVFVMNYMSNSTKVYAKDHTSISTLSNARYTPTIQDNFSDDKVIVTLKSQYSHVNELQSYSFYEIMSGVLPVGSLIYVMHDTISLL